MTRTEKNNATYREDQCVEQNGGNVERLPPAPQEEVGPLEVIGSHRKAEERNQAISGRSWDTTGRDQRRECDLTGEDGAQQHGAKGEHNGNSVAWLLRLVDLSNPARQGQDTVPSNREDEARSGDNGNARTL